MQQDKGCGLKLREKRFRLNILKTLFMLRIVEDWHMLPGEVVNIPPLEIFQVSLDKADDL